MKPHHRSKKKGKKVRGGTPPTRKREEEEAEILYYVYPRHCSSRIDPPGRVQEGAEVVVLGMQQAPGDVQIAVVLAGEQHHGRLKGGSRMYSLTQMQDKMYLAWANSTDPGHQIQWGAARL